MTAPDAVAGRRLDRWSGGCLIVAGLLLLSTAPHPDVFESTFAEAALDTPFWVAMHAALLVSAILSLVALLGLYAPRAARLGRLGAVGFVLAVIGLVVAACAFYWEAFLLPAFARDAPELFAWDGPVVSSWGVRTGALAGLWLVGLVLFGFALWRSGVVPRGAALTLAVAAAAFALLEGPFVPVAGPLSTVALAAAHVWVGVAVWVGAAEPSDRPRKAPARGRRAVVPTGRG